MFKARMRFAKEGRARFISHLDLMHAMQRAMQRCQMPIWFTEGFNQHAYISIALPLSTGYSGECEFLDFQLVCDAVPENAVEALNAVLPQGLRAIEIYPIADGGMKVGAIAWSRWRIEWGFETGVPAGFADAVRGLWARPVVELVKKSKRGEKQINMKEWMRDCVLSEQSDSVVAEVTAAAGNESISPSYFTRAIEQYLPQYPSIPFCTYHRLAVYTADGTPFR